MNNYYPFNEILPSFSFPYHQNIIHKNPFKIFQLSLPTNSFTYLLLSLLTKQRNIIGPSFLYN